MDRRSFLSSSALGSATALAGIAGLGAQAAGCGGARPMLGGLETAELLTRLERGLSAIRDVPEGTMAAAMPWQVRPEHHEAIARLGLEALVVADVNRSVPLGTDVPRELRERLEAQVPTLERAVGTYHAFLSRMPPAARRNMDRRLRARPDAAMETAEWLDGYAVTMGVAQPSRLLMRSTAADVGTRMRRQSVGAVIDDSLAKVERALGRSPGARAHATSATTVAMIDAIWQTVEGAGGGSASPPPASGGTATVAVSSGYAYSGDGTVEPTTERYSERWARPGDHDIEVGAILMPFGLITCTILLWVGIGILVHGINLNNEWDAEHAPPPG